MSYRYMVAIEQIKKKKLLFYCCMGGGLWDYLQQLIKYLIASIQSTKYPSGWRTAIGKVNSKEKVKSCCKALKWLGFYWRTEEDDKNMAPFVTISA